MVFCWSFSRDKLVRYLFCFSYSCFSCRGSNGESGVYSWIEQATTEADPYGMPKQERQRQTTAIADRRMAKIIFSNDNLFFPVRKVPAAHPDIILAAITMGLPRLSTPLL